MSGQTRVDRIVLSDVIGRLPPGRARKKYEDLLVQFDDGESQGGVLCKGVSTPNQGNVSGKSQTACFALIAKTSTRKASSKLDQHCKFFESWLWKQEAMKMRVAGMSSADLKTTLGEIATATTTVK